jgi:hypothetical protein
VTAPSRRCARLIAEAAEQHRKVQALAWLGEELPPWPEPCPIKVAITNSGSAGATTFAFERGAVKEQHMHLEGALDQILADSLPHEVTHTVFAHHLGVPVPRWADEGAAIMSEDDEEQQRHEKLLRQILDTPGRAIPLRRLFPMRDFPSDVMVLFAEGYSVTHFLVERKDRRTFLAFVKQGMKDDWDGAADRHYGFRDVKDLEQGWFAQFRRDRAGEEGDDRPVRGGRAHFPNSPPPDIAFARVDGDGRLFVRRMVTAYQPVESHGERDGRPEKRTAYEETRVEGMQRWDAADVRAFGVDGKRLDAETLAGRLREETAILVSADGKDVDPFHLQLTKEGTVILVLPIVTPVAPPPPAPAVPPKYPH